MTEIRITFEREMYDEEHSSWGCSGVYICESIHELVDVDEVNKFDAVISDEKPDDLENCFQGWLCGGNLFVMSGERDSKAVRENDFCLSMSQLGSEISDGHVWVWIEPYTGIENKYFGPDVEEMVEVLKDNGFKVERPSND